MGFHSYWPYEVGLGLAELSRLVGLASEKNRWVLAKWVSVIVPMTRIRSVGGRLQGVAFGCQLRLQTYLLPDGLKLATGALALLDRFNDGLDLSLPMVLLFQLLDADAVLLHLGSFERFGAWLRRAKQVEGQLGQLTGLPFTAKHHLSLLRSLLRVMLKARDLGRTWAQADGFLSVGLGLRSLAEH